MRAIYRRLLHWSFERLYHEFAWSYDLVAAAVSRGHWRHLIVAAMPFLQGGCVLEIGCGTGFLQLALAQASIPHVGCDASRQMLRQARRRLLRARVPLRLLRGRAQELPFAPATFTDVVATFPAPYILGRATLDEIRRVLRPGGQLLIVDGGTLHAGGVYAAAVDAAVRATLQTGAEERYTRRLVEAGFAVEGREVAVGRSTVGVILARRTEDHADRRI